MKKLLVFGLVVGGLAAMTACKKDYTCTYDSFGTEIVTDYPGLSKAEATSAKSSCSLLGGTWATK